MSDIVVFEGDFVTDVCKQMQAPVFLFDRRLRGADSEYATALSNHALFICER